MSGMAIWPRDLPQEVRFRTRHSARLYMVVGKSSKGVMQARIFETDIPSTAAKVAAGSHHAIRVYHAPMMYCGPTLEWAKIQSWHKDHMRDNAPEDLA